MMDALDYTYEGNRLMRVDDGVSVTAYAGVSDFQDGANQADEYAYDANGNLTKDLNRNICEIQYNILNLPRKVVFAGGDSISYVYAADGTKLRSTATIGGVTTKTDYCGNVIYENGFRKYLLVDGGYVTLSDGKYHYYLRDHQGNNRVVAGADGTVEEVNHYYPFGGIFASSGHAQSYKYNGKELEKSLPWYDYGARRYDAVLGRFTTVDPSAESYYGTAPYAYCGNNPVMRIDPTGADWIQDRYGSFLWDDKADSPESTRVGWSYVGTSLPEGVSQYRILEEIDGSLYHKHTINPFASAVNAIAGKQLLVAKKAYRPAEELMMQQLVSSTGEMVLGAAAGKAFGRLVGSLGGEGFESFAAFKKAKGAAGEGMAWHHIVEQHADNVARFGARKIHNTKNLIRLPNGKGSIHAKVSGYYSSIMRDKNMRVRDYVKTLSFEEQYKYGINVLKQFGWKP